MLVVLIKFLVCSFIIILAGVKVAKYGDIIAEKTGWGRALVGLFLLALITSLPEVFCGISAVTFIEPPDGPDLALGAIFGSCIFNLLILAVLDIINKKQPLLYQVNRGHIFSAGCVALFIVLVLASILLSQQKAMPGIGWIGLYTLIIPLVYILMIKRIFRYERTVKPPAREKEYSAISLKATWLRFSIASAVVISTAMWLPSIGEEIAKTTGLANTFVGTLFLAATTSFPELVVAFTAWRIGAKDMAIANILGSNLFDIFIIAIDDVFYLKGPFLAAVNPAHIWTGVIAIIMTLVVIIGVMTNSKRKTFRIINWDALVIILLFFTGAYYLYHLLGTI